MTNKWRPLLALASTQRSVVVVAEAEESPLSYHNNAQKDAVRNDIEKLKFKFAHGHIFMNSSYKIHKINS
jgi:hypothetical protein